MVDDYTIEPTEGRNEVMVIEHSIYPRSSVLCGRACRSRRGYYSTVEDALKEYPGAQVMEHIGGDPFDRIFGPIMSDVPPSDLDPTICGEVWHEDDT